jgi:hypothetical protein
MARCRWCPFPCGHGRRETSGTRHPIQGRSTNQTGPRRNQHQAHGAEKEPRGRPQLVEQPARADDGRAGCLAAAQFPVSSQYQAVPRVSAASSAIVSSPEPLAATTRSVRR